VQRVPVGWGMTCVTLALVTDPIMMGSVQTRPEVQVGLQGLSGNSLCMNLGWFRIHTVP
jgi:hypothetical protein